MFAPSPNSTVLPFRAANSSERWALLVVQILVYVRWLRGGLVAQRVILLMLAEDIEEAGLHADAAQLLESYAPETGRSRPDREVVTGNVYPLPTSRYSERIGHYCAALDALCGH